MKSQRVPLRMDGLGTMTVGIIGLAAIGAAIAFAYVPPHLPVQCDGDCSANLDLLAQTQMAAAAWFMAAMAVVSIFIGVATMIMIVLTLREARRSADASEEVVEATLDIGKRQVRAYLSVEKATLNIDSDFVQLNLSAKLRNAGQSPAQRVHGKVVLRFVEYSAHPDGEVTTEDRLVVEADLQAPDISAGQTIDLNPYFATWFKKPSLGEIFQDTWIVALEATLSIKYTDVFGDTDEAKCKLTAIAASVEQISNGLDFKIGPVVT